MLAKSIVAVFPSLKIKMREENEGYVSANWCLSVKYNLLFGGILLCLHISQWATVMNLISVEWRVMVQHCFHIAPPCPRWVCINCHMGIRSPSGLNASVFSVLLLCGKLLLTIADWQAHNARCRIMSLSVYYCQWKLSSQYTMLKFKWLRRWEWRSYPETFYFIQLWSRSTSLTQCPTVDSLTWNCATCGEHFRRINVSIPDEGEPVPLLHSLQQLICPLEKSPSRSGSPP